MVVSSEELLMMMTCISMMRYTEPVSRLAEQSGLTITVYMSQRRCQNDV